MPREAEEEVKKKQNKQTAKSKNNATFGKLIENPESKVDVKIVTTRKHYLQWSLRLTFKEKSVEYTSIN